ncbi:MAG: hypothetical protein CMO55_04030 [Verrucomicrobiales bacterium]|nr:hypothetical protein [Verrucomicrobiales bacterium]
MNSLGRRSLLIALGVAIAGLAGFQIGKHTSGTPWNVPADAPLIGIASLTSEQYIRAVRESGGIPIVLPNADGSTEKLSEYLAILDGLLLPGGADIPPSEYGEKPHETVEVLDDNRYLFEKALCRAWIKKTDKPMLGICLGGQWINVASGGTLIQDIPSEVGSNHRISHPVSVEPDSRLFSIVEERDFDVNSSHHQAVGDLGKNLRIVARSPDGVVEATETTDPDRFLIGVQWHPERLMFDDQRQMKLLRAFIEAAYEAKKQREEAWKVEMAKSLEKDT